MSALKKVKIMVIEMNNQGVFNEMLRRSMEDYLESIQQEYICHKEEDLTDFYSIIIGFLLIRR